MAFSSEHRIPHVKKNKGFYLSIPIFIGVFLLHSCTEKVKQKDIYTEEELGETLFFDPILSRDSSISCASCHKPEFAFADNTPLSTGVFGRKGLRNTPSVMNQTNRNFYFW